MAMSAQDLQNANAAARAIVLANAIEMRQPIFSTTVSGTISSSNNVLNIAPRNVGLIKGFVITVTAQAVVTTTSSTATLTNFGPANLLSQITFTDLNNNQRIQTQGWHCNVVNSAKPGRVFGSAFTTDSPIKYGNNYTKIVAGSNITTAGATITSTLYMMYYVPIAYSDTDLRGAIWANVVNATMNLQLQINATAFAASAAVGSMINNVYTGVAGNIQNVAIQVYQIYLDQLPLGSDGRTPILPPLDLSTVYELKATNLIGMNASVDFPIPYPNFRQFYSTSVIYDNNATYNTGSDINYWALQSANYTNIFKEDPYFASLFVRQEFNDDLPSGAYYFSHRRKPLETVQYGNLNLILNASSVGTGATVFIGFEDMAVVNQVVAAGSLPGG